MTKYDSMLFLRLLKNRTIYLNNLKWKDHLTFVENMMFHY